MLLAEFLHTRLFKNADYLFPCTGVVRLTLNRLNCKCDPVTVIGIGTRIDFDHGPRTELCRSRVIAASRNRMFFMYPTRCTAKYLDSVNG